VATGGEVPPGSTVTETIKLPEDTDEVLVTTEPSLTEQVVRIPYAICLKGCGEGKKKEEEEDIVEERVYTVPLSKAWISPRTRHSGEGSISWVTWHERASRAGS
jgi:hypothetical protein